MNEITKVVKRDGKTVEFDACKIKNAIKKAFLSSNETVIDDDLIDGLTNVVIYNIATGLTTPTVEEIQDEVINVLIDKGCRKTALEYSNYRAEQKNKRERESYENLTKTFDDITKNGTESIVTKGSSGNGNVSVSEPMGKMLSYGAEASKQYAINHIVSKKFADAHKNGDIHIHDLDFYPTKTLTCVQMDLEKLFKGGFSTGHGYLREPNSIQSYAQLAAIALQANQNNQHGGQSVPAFDYYMSPGVRKSFNKNLIREISSSISTLFDIDEGDIVEKDFKEKMFFEKNKISLTDTPHEEDVEKIVKQICLTSDRAFANHSKIERLVYNDIIKAYLYTDKDTYQAMEGLIHNLNTMHSRAGAQVPFTSLNFGTDTSAEGRMVIKNFLLATESGLGNGETPIFPISIFKLKDGVSANPSDPNYDLFELAIRVTSKRLFPNFSFIDAPFNKQYYVEGKPETEVAYMGCRTRVIGNVCGEEVVTGRGNCSFTTINLPRLAIKAKLAYPNDNQEAERIDFFYKEFEKMLDLCRDQLLERFAFQGTATKENFNFLMGENIWRGSENLGRNESLANVIKQGTLSIGFIGLAETLKCLIGEHHGESLRAETLGKCIIGFMRDYTDKQTKSYGLNFTTLATPAEGLSGRFTRIDQSIFGTIEGVTDKEWYTNSFHIPVEYNLLAIEKIKKEAPYHALCNAGHISYVEVDGDAAKNPEAIKAIILAEKEAGMGYASVNHPVDRCPKCGYTGIINNECPRCKKTEGDGVLFERIRRITGYLVGSLNRWNSAKRAEETNRVKHNVSGEGYE